MSRYKTHAIYAIHINKQSPTRFWSPHTHTGYPWTTIWAMCGKSVVSPTSSEKYRPKAARGACPRLVNCKSCRKAMASALREKARYATT